MEKQAAKPKKSGAAAVRAAMSTDAGVKFTQALKTLDVGQDGAAGRKDVSKAMAIYVSFLQAEDALLPQALATLAAQSARLYLGAMHLLEQQACVRKPKAWAKKLQRAQKTSSSLKSWLKDAGDNEKLVDALSEVFLEKIKASKAATKARGSKARRGEGSDEATESQEAVSSDSERAVRRKKKAAKRARSSESEGEGKLKKKPSRRGRSSESQKEPAAKPAAACVELGPEDEASSVENAADEWDTPELLVAQAELVNAWDCVDKPGKFALEHLVALMDNVPRKVLEVWGLLKVQGTLKGMRHLPRREKVKEILGALQEAVDAAVVKPETPPQSPLFEG